MVSLLCGMAVSFISFSGCAKGPVADPGADAEGHTAPTNVTVDANAKVREALPLADPQDFEDARRGLIASHPNLQVKDADGKRIWDMPAYDFVKGDAPPSVNPSLWRQAQLNNIQGLFKVTDRIYQVRGFDVSNMTLIEGDAGWIVVDPLTTMATAAAAIAFAREHLGDKPVSALIFTHSHVDHFGGALGVVSAEDMAKRQIPVIAPEGFMEEATSENMLAGITMIRRAM
jgi:alkyl sulfatase BDS1-like metallo-beta-lactamase superfamily hydrolase